MARNFTLKVYTSTTIYELLYLVGQHVKLFRDEVKLNIPSSYKNALSGSGNNNNNNSASIEIRPRDNGKSLLELRIKNGECFTV